MAFDEYYEYITDAIRTIKLALTECDLSEQDQRDVMRYLACSGIDLVSLDSAIRQLESVPDKRKLAVDCAKVQSNIGMARVILSFNYMKDNPRLRVIDRADVSVAFDYLNYVLYRALKGLRVYL